MVILNPHCEVNNDQLQLCLWKLYQQYSDFVLCSAKSVNTLSEVLPEENLVHNGFLYPTGCVSTEKKNQQFDK